MVQHWLSLYGGYGQLPVALDINNFFNKGRNWDSTQWTLLVKNPSLPIVIRVCVDQWPSGALELSLKNPISSCMSFILLMKTDKNCIGYRADLQNIILAFNFTQVYYGLRNSETVKILMKFCKSSCKDFRVQSPNNPRMYSLVDLKVPNFPFDGSQPISKSCEALLKDLLNIPKWSYFSKAQAKSYLPVEYIGGARVDKGKLSTSSLNYFIALFEADDTETRNLYRFDSFILLTFLKHGRRVYYSNRELIEVTAVWAGSFIAVQDVGNADQIFSHYFLKMHCNT